MVTEIIRELIAIKRTNATTSENVLSHRTNGPS